MTVNTKRYLAAALCAVMLLEGLTGCGKKPPVKTETTAPSAAETTQPTVPATMPQDGNPGDVTCKGSYTADSVNASAMVATVGNEQLTNGRTRLPRTLISLWTPSPVKLTIASPAGSSIS